MSDTIHIKLVNHGGFPGILLWDDQAFEIFFSCLNGDRKCTLNRLYSSIHTQLPHHHIVFDIFTESNLAGRTEYANGNRQIKSGTAFFNISGSKTDHHFCSWHVKTVCLDGALNSLHTFLYGVIRQTYYVRK